MRWLWLTLMLAGPVFAQDGGVKGRAEGDVFDVEDSRSVQKAEAFVVKATSGVRASLPPEWKKSGWLGLQHWQWLGLPAVAALAGALSFLVSFITRRLVRRFASVVPFGKALGQQTAWPLRTGWFAFLMMLGLPAVALSPASEAQWDGVLKLVLLTSIFWGALRAVNSWSEHFATTTFVQARPGSRALVNLTTRVLRFILAGLAVMVLLSELGYSVTSVLAGLGIGGIALALGAQKTLENLFGAFALAVDQPIREGDFVKVDDVFSGTVETIGLRSTRIRTLDRTVVSIPNGKLADLRLETYAARDRIRFTTRVGLVYGTTGQQLEQVLTGFRAALAAQEKYWPEGSTVSLAALGDSSLEIEVVAFFATTDFDGFRKIREQVLIDFVKVVEAAGTQLAFKTFTVLQG